MNMTETLAMPETKRVRFEARTDMHTLELFKKAASVTGTTSTTFVLEAAKDRALEVLARHDVTLVPTAQFDAIMAALDSPPVIIEPLVELFSRPEIFTRA